MKKLMLAGLMAVILPMPAMAEGKLVYLECETVQGASKTPVKWSITLNEEQGVVDYNTEVSGPQRRAARYTADSVFFIGFELSRVDLSIKRTDPVTETGTCKLAPPKKRAF